MQSVSDDAIRKILLEKSRSELAVKGVFRLEGCYIFRQGVPDLWAMQQPGKQAWLIAWPLAPEDDFACIRNEATVPRRLRRSTGKSVPFIFDPLRNAQPMK